MLLAGKNGTGKTTIAESIYHTARIPHHPTAETKLFYTQVDLFLAWQKQQSEWGQTAYLLERVIEPKLLVLDDIGTRKPSESFRDFIYAIIEKRERQKEIIGTIITTNLNSESMRVMFGDAIISRVASGEVVRFEGKDRRFKDF